MRVRMSSFTCTLTGGSQFAICNLRNLREHFLSKLRRFPERVDTSAHVNFVSNLSTVLVKGREILIFSFSHFEKIGADFKKICPDCL